VRFPAKWYSMPRSYQELSVKEAMTHAINIIGIEGEP
jgi:hypothetical protein